MWSLIADVPVEVVGEDRVFFPQSGRIAKGPVIALNRANLACNHSVV